MKERFRKWKMPIKDGISLKIPGHLPYRDVQAHLPRSTRPLIPEPVHRCDSHEVNRLKH